MKEKILVSFPMDPGHPYQHKMVSMALWNISRDNRYELTPIWPCYRPYENNLHHILNYFMSNNFNFWLNIDSDNPPLKNPLDLVELNKDIIGLPTPIWHYKGIPKERPIYWNGYNYVKEKDAYLENQNRKGLQKVDAIGTGCFLISRRVFFKKEMRIAPFMRQYNEDGTVYKGNDISFCEKARNNGFEIFCHYDYLCDHYISLGMNEIVKAFKNLYEDNE